jgi:hypothetical protein
MHRKLVKYDKYPASYIYLQMINTEFTNDPTYTSTSTLDNFIRTIVQFDQLFTWVQAAKATVDRDPSIDTKDDRIFKVSLSAVESC